MISTALSLARLKCPEASISVEAASDQGVTTRLLDLLSSQGRFPTSFALERRDDRLHFTLGVPSADERTAKRLAVDLLGLPGVFGVSATPALTA